MKFIILLEQQLPKAKVISTHFTLNLYPVIIKYYKLYDLCCVC